LRQLTSLVAGKYFFIDRRIRQMVARLIRCASDTP
jgi:hypothetical protein